MEAKNTILVLNPFSCKLGKTGADRYYNLTDKKCVYQNGIYKTFKFGNEWFVTCRKNIIVTETTGIPKELIDALVAARCPKEQNKRFRYLAIEEAYFVGRRFAKEENFKVKNI